MATYSIIFDSILSASTGTISIGNVLVLEESGSALTGYYVKATTGNRGSRRSTGIARTPGDSVNRSVQIQVAGPVPASVSGLGAGSASWVRVSSAGVLERCTPGAGDDLLGKCDAYGTLWLDPGVWDSTNYTSSAGTVPTGTGFPHITSGSQDAAAKLVEHADVHASAAIAISKLAAIAASDIASGTLLHERGGLEADVSAYSGLVKITGGATSAVAAPSGTVVGTSDSQTLTNKAIDADQNTITNIENADIKAGAGIAISKLAAIAATDIASGTLIHERGGLEADVSAYSGLVKITGGATSAVAAPTGTIVGHTDTQTLTNKTIDLASNTLTFTSAQLATACSNETGSGALVFGTSPTIATPSLGSPSITGVPNITTFTTNGSTGTLNDVSRSSSAIVEFTHATGPTVNGFDATGAVDGTLVGVYVSGGNVLIAHEDEGSSAANRFTLSSGINITCTTGSITWFIYRTSRWRALTASAI